jgi:hypothetical protein
VTVNIWALQPQGYFSVVVHYVDDQWRIQSPVVAFKRFATQPTAKALSESILAALKEFSISDQVVYLDVFDAVAASVGDANAAAENGESSASEIVQNQFSGVRLGKMIRALKKLLLDSLVVGECKVQVITSPSNGEKKNREKSHFSDLDFQQMDFFLPKIRGEDFSYCFPIFGIFTFCDIFFLFADAQCDSHAGSPAGRFRQGQRQSLGIAEED